ncbi:unnamed protein product, partial [Urochloa humidicola]
PLSIARPTALQTLGRDAARARAPPAARLHGRGRIHAPPNFPASSLQGSHVEGAQGAAHGTGGWIYYQYPHVFVREGN